MEMRRRHLLIDLPERAESLAPGRDIAEVFTRYGQYVAKALKAGSLVRGSAWTESVAVCSDDFVREIGSRIDGRMKMDIAPADGLWFARESRDSCSLFSAPPRGSNGSDPGHLQVQLVDALA
jgi:hypothetical protein